MIKKYDDKSVENSIKSIKSNCIEDFVEILTNILNIYIGIDVLRVNLNNDKDSGIYCILKLKLRDINLL